MCEIGLCYQVRFRTFRGIYISFVVKYNKKARKDCTRMGNYLNPDNSKFQRAVNSDIYVDKTGLIADVLAASDTPCHRPVFSGRH